MNINVLLRVCSVVLMSFYFNTMYSQKNAFLDCSEFYSDVKTFNAIEDYSNRTRAKGIMEMGKMNRDNAIHWQYVVATQDSVDVERFMKTVKRWQKQAFKSDEVVKEETDTSILYEAYLPQVALVTGYMSATAISVNLLLKIEVKADRIRVTGNVQHYNMGTANLGGASSKLIVVGEAFPFVNTKKKDSFSMAYINSNVRLINLMDSFFKYVNENYATVEEQIKEEEDW